MGSLGYDRYPTGSRVEVWWPGDKKWYLAEVTETRTQLRTIRREKVLCREIYCLYALDGLDFWHSLHNTRVRVATTTTEDAASSSAGA